MSSAAYQGSTAITKISQELWDMIAYNMPAFDAMSAAQALGFKLQPRQKKQGQLWNAIFRDSTWITEATIKLGLNPVLIGRDLYDYYSIETLKVRALYLVLVVGDPAGNIQFDRDLFLESLRPHNFHINTMEVYFESGITLNVANVYQVKTFPDPGYVSVRPQRLFTDQQGRLQTAYVYWQDNQPILRMLGHEGMAGDGEEASKLQLVLNICGFTLSHEGRPMQYNLDIEGPPTALE